MSQNPVLNNNIIFQNNFFTDDGIPDQRLPANSGPGHNNAFFHPGPGLQDHLIPQSGQFINDGRRVNPAILLGIDLLHILACLRMVGIQRQHRLKGGFRVGVFPLLKTGDTPREGVGGLV